MKIEPRASGIPLSAVDAPKPAPKPAELRAAREFEAIFLRKLLGSLERTTQLGGKSSFSGGTEVYGSMMVGALADAIATAGGIGLAPQILESFHHHEPPAPGAPEGPDPASPSISPQETAPPAVQPGRESPEAASAGPISLVRDVHGE